MARAHLGRPTRVGFCSTPRVFVSLLAALPCWFPGIGGAAPGRAIQEPAVGDPVALDSAGSMRGDSSTSESAGDSGEEADSGEGGPDEGADSGEGDSGEGADSGEGDPDEEADSGEDGVDSGEPGEDVVSADGARSSEAPATAPPAGSEPSGNEARPAQLSEQEHPLTPPPAPEGNRRKDAPTAIRWSSVGAFAGMVVRPSGSKEIVYRPGIAYGGYFRPELLSWLGVRLYYRKEFIPVDAKPGAFDTGDTPDLDFEQPKLNVTSLGLRVEPAWVVHPRLRVLGIVGWSWLRFVAELPEAPGFDLRAKRAAVEMNWQLGAGVSIDLVKNWVELSVVGTYNIVASQTGSAYEPIQGVYDGEIVHLGALPRLKNATDVLVSLGLIL